MSRTSLPHRPFGGEQGGSGSWALEHWRPSDSGLIEGALARETGTDKKAAMDMSDAYFFGFRVEVIARGGVDPEDR